MENLTKYCWTILMTATMVHMAQGQGGYTVDSYISKYRYIAVEEMEKTGIPASITLAQGILESRYGNSELALRSNNHFGIKCHKGWTGKRHFHDDDKKNECFRVYRNAEQSFRDHSDFLLTRSRYEFLFDYDKTDYKKWAHGLKKAGYATNPRYGHLLIDLIEKHDLQQYDRPGKEVLAAANRRSRVNAHRDYKIHGNGPEEDTDDLSSADSKGVFSFNRINTVVVMKYDNLEVIARRYQLPVSRLIKYNDLQPSAVLAEGQYLYLQPKRIKTQQRRHLVGDGQTLWEISQLYGVKLRKLRQRNMLETEEEPAAGQTVYLNRTAPSRPLVRGPDRDAGGGQELADAGREGAGGPSTAKQSIADPEAGSNVPGTVEVAKYHTVMKGDTLYGISRTYGVSVEDLKKWNRLADHTIGLGQQLIVGP